MTTTLNITDITLDPRCQLRDINETAIDDYAEAMQDGATFPPITVFHDGESYWLADGFHRVAAAEQAGVEALQADIEPGDVRRATLHAAGANNTHGLRRSNADKRRSVETMLADAEWSQWSDRKVAKQCGVTHPFVAKVRRELSGNRYHPEAWVETMPGFISYTVYPGDLDQTTQSVHEAVRAEYGKEGLRRFQGRLAILGDIFTKVNPLTGEERFQVWLTAIDEVDFQFLPAVLWAAFYDTFDTFTIEDPAWHIVRATNGAAGRRLTA